MESREPSSSKENSNEQPNLQSLRLVRQKYDPAVENVRKRNRNASPLSSGNNITFCLPRGNSNEKKWDMFASPRANQSRFTGINKVLPNADLNFAFQVNTLK